MSETQTQPELSAGDFRLIRAALMQRITSFSESRAACHGEDGNLKKPDAHFANYAVIDRLFTEQIDEAQELLERLGGAQ